MASTLGFLVFRVASRDCQGNTKMTLWSAGAVALGIAITAIGVTVWWFQRGRLEYLAWTLRGGASLSIRDHDR
jgi:hypothetical protein